MINTYVINLPECKDRRVYMEDLLDSYEFLSVNFISAVDGRKMSEEEVADKFDRTLAYARYGRELKRSEIGCTLSHFKCYQELISSEDKFALILEDDITILRDIKVLDKITQYIDIEEPVILLLSGDYWYYRHFKIDEEYSLTSVYDAVGAYAYLINVAAAKLILHKNKRGGCVADNWSLYRTQGIVLKAIYPYLMDANIGPFVSTIEQSYFGEKRRNMPWRMKMSSYTFAICKKILLWRGNFVSKIRKGES